MWHRCFAWALSIVVLSGCVNSVALEPEGLALGNTGYDIGHAYVLRKSVYMHRVDRQNMSELRGIHEGLDGLPVDLERYRASPEAWATVVGVLDPGAVIKLAAYRLVENPIAGVLVYVEAVVVSGEYKGARVELSWVSTRGNEVARRADISMPFTWLRRDPAYLEPLK